MKRLKKGILILVIIVGILLLGIQLLRNEEVEETYIEYGDSFENLLLIDSHGNEFNFPKEGKAYKIVYFFDEKCGTCVEKLPFIERINKLVSSEMDVYLLWNKDIKANLVQKYHLDLINNIQLDMDYSQASRHN